MLTHKWSQEVSSETGYYVSYLWSKVSSRSSWISLESCPAAVAISHLKGMNWVNVLIAKLYCLYFRKAWRSRAYHLMGLRLDHTAPNCILPTGWGKPQRNTQAHDAATHQSCNKRRVQDCAYSHQLGCDSWITLGPWLQTLLSLWCLLGKVVN